MKSQFDDYNLLLDINRIMDIFNTIKANSKHKEKIFNFQLFLSCNTVKIYDALEQQKYVHDKYNIFLLKESKYRIIMSECITDKIVNQLVSKYILFPIIEKKLIPTNVATRPGYGTEKGMYYVKKYINKLKVKYDKFYILKCDIYKYFYSIDHEILIEKTNHVISDENVRKIIRNIVDSTDQDYINEKIEKVIADEKIRLSKLNINDYEYKCAELDRIPKYIKGKGLPIGNMSSQILAIFYLNDLDHYIKEKLHIKYYIRYMDDFILFHEDKEYLKYCYKEIAKRLSKLKLHFNNKTQILEINHGFNFLGYKFKLKGKKLLILLNRKTKIKIKKKLQYLKSHNPPNKLSVIGSYKGYLQRAHSGSFCYQNNLKYK